MLTQQKQTDIKVVISDIANLVQQRMDLLLPKKDLQNSSLASAMRYGSLSNGKRLRAFLVIATSDLFDVDRDYSLNVAAAIEFIHAYSLIHDDLPAMDNDDMRRGQPSCHKKFDEATAILAGDTLLTFALEVLSRPETCANAEIRCKLINAITKAIGFYGMAGGQSIDINSTKIKLDYEQFVNMQAMKTGQLFIACCNAGAILGETSDNLKNSLIEYAKNIGLSFQITDDLLDGDITESKIEEARIKIKSLENAAIDSLKVFGSKAYLLEELAKFITTRTK